MNYAPQFPPRHQLPEPPLLLGNSEVHAAASVIEYKNALVVPIYISSVNIFLHLTSNC